MSDIYCDSDNTFSDEIKQGDFCLGFKNGNKLMKSDEKTPLNELEFFQDVKRNVSSFVNQSFSNIVVLIGAGASVVSNDEGINNKFGKTVSMIAQSVFELLGDGDENVYSLDELSRIVKYEKYSVISKDGINQLNTDDFNLEDFLSNLISYMKFSDVDEIGKLEKSKESIFNLIKEKTSYEYDTDIFKHGKLLNILSRKLKEEKKLNVVTTNYDTLIEDAAENLKYTVFDGFSFSQIPIFDDDMFEWNLVKDVPNVKTNEYIYKKHVINLLKIHGSLTWELNTNLDIIRKNKAEVNNPIMIFPSSNKYIQSYEEPYFELFSRFQDMLKKPNTLFITVGFSFADNHITRMIKQAIVHNEGLHCLFTDYDIDDNHEKSQNFKDLKKLKNEKYPIAFLKATMNGKLTDYLGEQNEYRQFL